MNNTGPDVRKTAFYKGESMRGIFVPGEILSLEERSFETLREGDVVAIFSRTPYIVHRIIEKNTEYAVTMGDNNDRPDAHKLTPDDAFRLVTGAVSLNGINRSVDGGEAGMRLFRRRQRKRKLRHFAGWLIRPLKPLKDLRVPADTETRFRDGTVQWSRGNIPVATVTPNGRIVYRTWSKRLFFRVPATDAFSPGQRAKTDRSPGAE